MTAEASIVEDILRRYPRDPASLIMVMQDLQAALNCLPEHAIGAVARRLGVPRSRVYSAATFYKAFSLQPRGKHQVDVCQGTACHVRGASRLVGQVSSKLGIQAGGTTQDGEFSLNSVHCVGACALGPVVVIDGEYHGEMTPRKLTKALERCRGRHVAPRPTGAREGDAGIAWRPERLPGPEALVELRQQLAVAHVEEKAVISICAGSGCRALGAGELAAAFEEAVAERGLAGQVRVQRNGCHGFCERGLMCVVRPAGIYYQRLKPKDAREIVERTVQRGDVIESLLYRDPETGKRIVHEQEVPFYSRQRRLLMRQNAIIDPLRIDDYIAVGGYESLSRVLFERSPESVIEEVKKAGLRGRGGGGFPTARKWASCRKVSADTKYVLCNADEGDPGAFMDCSLLEGNPHSVLEGMIIGAYAIASGESRAEGYVYVRNEYPVAVAHLEVALRQARAAGLLGENILGSGFSYDIRISRGGGSFVCGESTALMASIEGKIGEPRAKYVHTAASGLWGKPTVLNNVETWANVPLIVREGGAGFAAVGTQKSAGTKIFSLVGKVNNTGLVEVPMGISLREIVHGIGGGIRDGKRFKAVQTGGPSGGCVPESLLDLPVDFEDLTRVGSMMGSGGMIVMDETTCMVDLARYFTEFLTEESCGKCGACRLGLGQLLEILNRVCRGQGLAEDIPAMQRLFGILDDGSLCGLGKSAANPVRSTLRYFPEEYQAHIAEKRCPAGVCRSLVRYRILEFCPGCTLCLDVCPEGAISGKSKQVHVIDQGKCNRCGLCVATCKFDAIASV